MISISRFPQTRTLMNDYRRWTLHNIAFHSKDPSGKLHIATHDLKTKCNKQSVLVSVKFTTARLPSKFIAFANKRYESKHRSWKIVWLGFDKRMLNSERNVHWRRRSLSIAKHYNFVDGISEKNKFHSNFFLLRLSSTTKYAKNLLCLNGESFFTFFSRAAKTWTHKKVHNYT